MNDPAYIMGRFGSSNSHRSWWLVGVGTQAYWLTRRSSSSITVLSSAAGALAAGEVHHVAGTYASGSQKLYVDGVEVATASTPGDLLLTSEPTLTVGTYDAAAGRWVGRMQGAAVHGSALSPARILAHAQAAGLAA